MQSRAARDFGDGAGAAAVRSGVRGNLGTGAEILVHSALCGVDRLGGSSIRHRAGEAGDALGRAGRALDDAAVLATLLLAVWVTPELFATGMGRRLVGTAGVLAAHGLVTVACLAGWTRDDKAWWRWIAVAALAVGAGGLIVGIWQDMGGDPTLLLVIWPVGGLVAHANLILLVLLRDRRYWLRLATVSAAGVTIAIVDALALAKVTGDTLLTRAAVATGILAICWHAGDYRAGPAQPRRPRRRRTGADATTPSVVAVTCPVCHKELMVRVGDSSCDGCGLRFKLQIELPLQRV